MIDYALMNQRLYEGKAAEVRKMAEEAVAAGIPVETILNDGLIAGMAVVGEDFKHSILYVPEVLIAARAMKAAMEVLRPLLTEHAADVKPTGTLVIGTVQGDLHDIGKNLVCMMAEGAGFKVVNIGVDKNTDDFINAAKEHNADIVGMSALLTTTMLYMKKVIDALEAAGLGHLKTAVGGAPVTQMFADEIGADAYGPDAATAVETFIGWCKKA